MSEKSTRINKKRINEFNFFEFSEQKEAKLLKDESIRNFICNYLSYCSDKELEKIQANMYQIGILNIFFQRNTSANYKLYKPEPIFEILEKTELTNNEFLKPFFISSEFRKQMQSPENRFSTISRKYQNLLLFMQIMIYSFGMNFDKDISLTQIAKESNIKALTLHIDKQLLSNKSKYLLTILLSTESKKIQVLKFDLEDINLKNFYFEKRDKCFILYSKNDKSDMQPIDDKNGSTIFNILSLYDKKETKKNKVAKYNNAIEDLDKIINKYSRKYAQKEAKEKLTTCPICGVRKFVRSKKLGVDTSYCTECIKLIDIIKDIKNDLGKGNIQRKSIIKSLTGGNYYFYCDKILSKVKKNFSISRDKIEKFEKQLEITYSAGYNP